MTRIRAITGTRREAGTLLHSGVEVLAIGGQSRDLERLSQGASGIVSFGMAGALSPDLRIGDWVIGESVGGAVEAACDARWRAALARALPQARCGAIHADGRLIADPAEKAALHRHGAIAADMESHIVAQAAADAGIPFAVLRCISDEAGHALPPAIAVAMRPDGRLALASIFKSIVRNPAQLPEISRTMLHFMRAFAALRQGARAVPANFAFDRR